MKFINYEVTTLDCVSETKIIGTYVPIIFVSDFTQFTWYVAYLRSCTVEAAVDSATKDLWQRR